MENTVALFGPLVEVVASSDTNGTACDTPGVPCTIAATWRTMASVRSSVAPAGSCSTVIR